MEPSATGVRFAEAMETRETAQQTDLQNPAASATAVAAPAPAPDPTLITNDVQSNAPAAVPPVQPVVVIIGFGLPGRFVAEVLDARQIPYAVVELNPSNARSIAACGKRVVSGDARDPNLLREAGVGTAQFLAVTLPDEKIVLEVLAVARQVNPGVRMMARCNYTSTGIKAERAGAFAVVVEEQIVALEFAKLIGNSL
jgi:monovalent cation:H+ antiporter-2, CPA2 family